MRVRRFKRRKALERVLKKGIKKDLPGASLYCLPGEERWHRVAVICPRRLIPKAVERNRIRRVFFESIRGVLRDFGRPFDCAVILRARPDVRNFKRHDADTMIAGALREIFSWHLD